MAPCGEQVVVVDGRGGGPAAAAGGRCGAAPAWGPRKVIPQQQAGGCYCHRVPSGGGEVDLCTASVLARGLSLPPPLITRTIYRSSHLAGTPQTYRRHATIGTASCSPTGVLPPLTPRRTAPLTLQAHPKRTAATPPSAPPRARPRAYCPHSPPHGAPPHRSPCRHTPEIPPPRRHRHCLDARPWRRADHLEDDL